MAIITRQISLNTSEGTFTSDRRACNHVILTDNRMVIVGNNTGVAPNFYTRAFHIVDMPDGLDSNQSGATFTRTTGLLDKDPFQGTSGVSVARLSDTRFVVSEPRSTGTIKIEIFEVTDTTITRVLSQNVLNSTGAFNNAYNATHVLIPLSATCFIQTFNDVSLSPNASAYQVFNYVPATTGPNPTAASLPTVRWYRETVAYGNNDISWQRIPGTTQTAVVNKIVNDGFYAYGTTCWIFDNQGTAVRTQFPVSGEPGFLGPNRYVVSRWGRQDYYKLNGSLDGGAATENYTGAPTDDTLYRPMIVPLTNDYHLQMRREFFQELDSAIFMKVVRRDDSNFHSFSPWSKSTIYGNYVNSSLGTTKVLLPFDKRVPVVSSNMRLVWPALAAGGYRIHMLEPTPNPPQNPPTVAPTPQPVRTLGRTFLFPNGMPSGATFTGSTPRFLNVTDPGLGSPGVIATPVHIDDASYTTRINFTVPGGARKAIVRYIGNSEDRYDYYTITVNGYTIVSQSGDSGGWVEREVDITTSNSTIQMVMSYNTDRSQSRGIAGVYVSMVRFSNF